MNKFDLAFLHLVPVLPNLLTSATQDVDGVIADVKLAIAHSHDPAQSFGDWLKAASAALGIVATGAAVVDAATASDPATPVHN
jgi:hypothetical protein